VNYALGLHDFNVAAHQPHPPGSPDFILLGRAILAIVGGDDNTALILLSLAVSVGAVLCQYALARLLFGPRAGVLAAVVLMTQPGFWGYGTRGMPWTLVACLALTVGLACQMLLRGQRWLVMPSALLLGLASGFRLEVTVFLGPLRVWRSGWPSRARGAGCWRLRSCRRVSWSGWCR
jgi:4-amino-4-deoxy-L-arabinose transferase-like glycosyltransferase